MILDNTEVKRRVVIALSLLAGAKLLNITVPFFFKHTVDMV
jgi:ATP-binding cassette subfamily B (MDR/TAP) protein 7